MKSAYEISRSAIFDIATRSGILRVEFEREIKQIQLDAMKEGMRRAAETANQKARLIRRNNEEGAPTAKSIQTAILTAAEQLTEKNYETNT